MAKENINLRSGLENRIRFKILLADLSAGFINNPADHEAADTASRWTDEVNEVNRERNIFSFHDVL